MPSKIFYDHGDVDSSASRAEQALEEGKSTSEKAEGVDPAATTVLEKRESEDKKNIDKTKESLEEARKGNREQEAESEESAARIKQLEDKISDLTSQGTHTTGGANPGGPGTLSGYNSNMAQQQMTNPYANGYLPTPAVATQYDLSHAPNKQALAAAIASAIKSGEFGTGENGDDRPTRGGETLKRGENDSERDGKVKDILDKYIAAKIEYAWGGGHGAEPGSSKGISDGGGHADAMGDYNKNGLDCSGFARAVVNDITGEDLANGIAATQYSGGKAVSYDEARPGDLVFPASPRPPRHVQVYAGDGMVAEAQQSGTLLKYSPIGDGSEFRRYDGD